MKGISVNGKFIGAPLNGVHRTAALYAGALLAHHEREADVEVVSPRRLAEDPVFAELTPRVLNSPVGSGQGWEMLALPYDTRRRMLVNFCNLAPLAHPDFVVMIHDAQTFLYPQDYTGRQAKAYRFLLPLIARRARRILTVSEFARQSLAEHDVAPLEKISVVHNGGDHLLRTSADDTVVERHGLVPGGFALALGSTKSYKNIACLFKAFDHPDLADLPLVIAGGPPAEDYLAADARPPASVRFIGRVSDAELRALYSHAAMFLFPSKTEGFGLPPLEAMTCDCAVIAAAAGAMPEVCGDGALLVDPEDADAWREAVVRFRAPEARQAYAPSAAERTRMFTWEKAGARLWDIVGDLAQ
ncbi:glycosyltransferase family 1 protein [Mangrovicoccus sp. HB161399]|uniref:glycosyltransferase family 4 protein n=1 Tax=Mangrovicoccus sp. HB161399 TaxID=2720392 RepID=UPI001557953A|nr:glycosyltransferase family 1 protein [Mangrovicoccus sp. HB161399]